MCHRAHAAAGSFIATMPVIVGDIVGDSDLAAALGYAYGCQVASVLLGAPAAGWLFNGTGTYTYSWCLSGGTVVGGAAMLLGIDQSRNRGLGGRGSGGGVCCSGGRTRGGTRLVGGGHASTPGKSAAVVPLTATGQVGAGGDADASFGAVAASTSGSDGATSTCTDTSAGDAQHGHIVQVGTSAAVT